MQNKSLNKFVHSIQNMYALSLPWVNIVGVQNKSPWDVLLWYADYFESKATEALQAQEKLLPLLNYLEKCKLGALPMIRVITRNNFFWPISVAGQTTNYWTSALLIILQWPASPLKPQGILPFSLAQHATYTSFYLSVSESLMYVGVTDSLTYVEFP